MVGNRSTTGHLESVLLYYELFIWYFKVLLVNRSFLSDKEDLSIEQYLWDFELYYLIFKSIIRIWYSVLDV